MQKKISCKRCQYRKLKCSRTEPCESCSEASKPCEYREQDKKKRPVSSKYVSELEERIAYLEGLIIKIRDTVPEARSIVSETSGFSEITLPPKIQSQPSPAVISPQPDNLEPDMEGSLIYHGPTSIIHGKLPQANRVATHPDNSTLNANTNSNFEQVAQHFGISLDNDLVTSALMHFFKWKYPQFMFIYREAFLRDHFGDRQSCKYWSSGLVLSICALGLLMSPNAVQRRAMYGFARPSIATVQAFLCLAFYEIGRGNMSKGWGFSEVENLERLPDFPELELWLPIGFDSQQGDFGETKPMVPCFQKQIELSKVIEQILATLFSQSAAQDGLAYRGHLDQLNLELSRGKLRVLS
ncbi:hypothetical protein FOXYS1_10981 [Fusarium oxysporum]|uniref:Zn(2)-C6 fungal-type domain-containing protein n=1 Tax=Fusarium oxysporum TaxID=5507 RepID=A0A8H5A5A2_FUSOX|nr:hypothetical protein FOXYS1_10981 [Fusarium oxysporum]